MKIKNNSLVYYGIVLAVALGLFLFLRGCQVPGEKDVIVTDTIYVKEPYKEIIIKEVEITKPVKVYVYQIDTVYRKKIEKDTLITGIEFTRKTAKIHTITPRGLQLVNEYPIREFNQILIDHEGRTTIQKIKHPKRKRFFKRLVKVGLIVGGLILGRASKK